MKLIIPLLVLMTVLSCKNNSTSKSGKEESNKETVNSQTPVKQETKPVSVKADEQYPDTNETRTYVDSGLSRLVISFYSIGEGSEFQLITQYEDSVGSFSTRIGKNFDYKRLSWGREGETDFCFPLVELSASEQASFVNMTRSVLKKAKWVHIYENYACPKRRVR